MDEPLVGIDDLVAEWEARCYRGELPTEAERAAYPGLVAELDRIAGRLVACNELLGLPWPARSDPAGRPSPVTESPVPF